MSLPDPAASNRRVPVRLFSQRQLVALALVLSVLLGGTLALIFGPGRGMRTDIVKVSDDLDASRGGIFDQLQIARSQLQLTEQSLTLQESGLEVAARAQHDSRSAARSSRQILEQTRETLTLIRSVTQALGPLDRLDDKVDSVVRDVEQGVALARAALGVAQQTLSTGRQALTVAKDTLATLKRSEQLQIELLAVARQTLAQTRELNHKIPVPPVFPASSRATS